MITKHTMSVDKAEEPKNLSEHTEVMELDSVQL